MAKSVLPAERHDLADLGFLVGDAGRAAMLLALMNDVARPASELARIAGVTPPTASAHLGRLVAGGLITVEQQGRHRYYRLADPSVAHALEAMVLVRPLAAERLERLHNDPDRRSLVMARLCYRHLAGRLGVQVSDAMIDARWLRRDGGRLMLTQSGRRGLSALGLENTPNEGRACLDWTERRHHLGGPLGVAWTQLLVQLAWIKRIGDGRAVRLTTVGRRELKRALELDAAEF